MSQLFETVSHVRRSAEISDCGKYRWWLRRSWQNWGPTGELAPSKGVCCFVMLNPSTADALKDDPTIRRCIQFAKDWGYDTLSVRNLFPFRTPYPQELRQAPETTGGVRGDDELLVAATAHLLVAAWGSDVPDRRDKFALAMFAKHFPQKEIYCLGTTKHGHPRHPLYVKGDTQPQLFQPREPR